MSGIEAKTGNISKSKGFKGDRGPQGIQGPIGPQGEKGDTPSVVLRYDPETGELFCDSDGILVDKEYVALQNLASKAYVDEAISKLSGPTRSFINIAGGDINWIAEDVYNDSGDVIGSRYGQIVNVHNAVITPRSKVDLQITSEQMVVFYEKSLAFVAENDEGVITIFCVGSIPQHDYTIQAIVTEVV